jgi:hypothetical protein
MSHGVSPSWVMGEAFLHRDDQVTENDLLKAIRQ